MDDFVLLDTEGSSDGEWFDDASSSAWSFMGGDDALTKHKSTMTVVVGGLWVMLVG